MPFCYKCGNRVSDKATFCFMCGAKVINPEVEEPSQRKQEWAGKIFKCPNCGETISSFTAICPTCRVELRSTKTSATLERFIQNINECDYRIMSNPNITKEGWASWSSKKKIWWVILNIFTLCLPLVIYLCMPFIIYNKVPNLSSDEQIKASLIENFPFPNDRESILEALLFIKSKMSAISSGPINRQSAYWSHLWSSKGEQLYAKALTLFKGDEIAEEAHKSIVESKTTTLELPETGIARTLPPLNKGGKIITNTPDNLVIEYDKITSYDFESYKDECDKKGFDEEVKEGETFYEAKNENGYYLIIHYNDQKMKVYVSKNN